MSHSRSKAAKPSILDGVDAAIDVAFGLTGAAGKTPKYRSPVYYRKGIKSQKNFDVTNLVETIHDQIKKNWKIPKDDKRGRSRKNWCLRQRPDNSNRKHSKEVTLERDIISLAGQENPTARDWANQVPIASGLVGVDADRRRCIDLVHKCDDRNAPCHDAYEFIELKTSVRSGTPVYAAMEILKYGIVYLFCRTDSEVADFLGPREDGPLNAKYIGLRVLAPEEFYSDYDRAALLQFAENITSSLPESTDVQRRTFRMDFKYQILSGYDDKTQALTAISRELLK